LHTLRETRKLWGMWVFLIVAVGFLLRLFCSRGDLWLDEIWSISLADNAGSPLDILTAIHHDNNHHLNTLVDYFLHDPQWLWLYRLGPVLAGSLAVFVAARCARSPFERRLAALLFAFSFLLVFYSSEARGYAYVMLFSLLAYLIFNLEFKPLRHAVIFTAVCILGFLSHLTFVYTYGGLLAAGIVCAWQKRDWREKRLWICLPAGAFFAGLWFLDLRFMAIGGDQPSDIGHIVLDTAGLLTGPRLGYLEGAAALLILTCSGAWILWKERNRSEQAFFLTAILLCPAAILMIRTQTYVSPRYFLVPAVFLLLLAARAFSRFPHKAALAVAGLFIGLNCWAVSQQERWQRGEYSKALTLICETDPSARVGSDHDFRNGLVIEFFAHRLSACMGLHYEPSSEWGKTVPGWLVLHSLDRGKPAPAEINPQGFGAYKLAGFFPSGEFSGWNWAVYRRETPP
jgi:uncharacterized membrane protein